MLLLAVTPRIRCDAAQCDAIAVGCHPAPHHGQLRSQPGAEVVRKGGIPWQPIRPPQPTVAMPLIPSLLAACCFTPPHPPPAAGLLPVGGLRT
jgi:hypothetical protein